MKQNNLRVMILGGLGMLGHKLVQTLLPRFDVFATSRSEVARRHRKLALGLASDHWLPHVDAMDFTTLRAAIERVAPHVVVNCIGVVKQSDAMAQSVTSIQINSLLPHQLAQLCLPKGIRVIQFSTDCVFSGRRGNYSEEDIADPVDLYGRSKLLGELDSPSCLTLRTSIVGWELAHERSLLGWFASERGNRIRGFRQAIFSGLSTRALASLVADLVDQQPHLHGVYHVGSVPISKFDLLDRLRADLRWDDIDVQPDDSFVCDRSLDSQRFREATGWTAPPWDVMIGDLARERAYYEAGALPDAEHDV